MKQMNLNHAKNSDQNNVPESIIQDNSGEKSSLSELSATEFFDSLKLDFHEYVKEVPENSIDFLMNLANIDNDEINVSLKIDLNDKTIPAKYRLVKAWIDEANKLQKQIDEHYPLPEEVSDTHQEDYKKYLNYLKKANLW